MDKLITMRRAYGWHHKPKVFLLPDGTYTATQHIAIRNKEIHMTTATITQAQDAFGGVLDFCRKLYAAFGGHIGPTPRREKQMSASQLLDLADKFEAYSPTLSAEIRSLAARA
jgi:hypothetical protein